MKENTKINIILVVCAVLCAAIICVQFVFSPANQSPILSYQPVAQQDMLARININTATLEQLMELPNIGEAKAENIIRYRQTHNGFASIEELKEVSGIGDKIFNELKDMITV